MGFKSKDKKKTHFFSHKQEIRKTIVNKPSPQGTFKKVLQKKEKMLPERENGSKGMDIQCWE